MNGSGQRDDRSSSGRRPVARPDEADRAQEGGAGAGAQPDRDPDRTIVTDLRGSASGSGPGRDDQPTMVTDLSGSAGPGVDHTRMTSPGGGLDATIRTPPPGAETMVTSPGRSHDETMATNLPGATPGAQVGDPTPGTIWGDYRFGRLLGRGGMGAVFAGTQVSLDRPVAIKVLPSHLSENADFRKRFVLEARSVAQISSPHVIQVYGAGVHQGHSYFAMEYVAGKDLSQRLKEGFRPTPAEATELILQAARGLAAAGDLGIVHRDIKPSNMMVTESGQLKIMDFGLVKMTKSEHSLTMTGTVMGTVTYFSPEQGRGDPCDQRTDLYALGVCFYELLTGLLPFTGDDPSSIIYQHLHAEPKLPREIDPSIPESHQAIVLKCMQKNPEHRYRNAHELIRDLELVRGGHQPKTAMLDPKLLRTGATIGTKASFDREGSSGRGGLVAVLILLLLAAGGAGAWYVGLLDPLLGEPAQETQEGARSDRGGIASVEAPPVAPEEAADPVASEPPALTRIRGFIRSGELDQARSALAAARADGATGPAWDQVEAELATERSRDLVAAVVAALDAGDLATARKDLSALRHRSSEHPRLAALTTRLAAVEVLARSAEVVQHAFESGDLDAGSAALERVAVEDLAPADERRLAELQRQLRSAEQLLATAERALVDGDLATARATYLQLLDRHGMSLAAQRLKVVSQATAFSDAIDAGRLGDAQAALDELVALGAADPLLEGRRRRLGVLRLEAELERAVNARDFATARERLASLREAGVDHARLREFEHRIELENKIVAFDRALSERDPAAAEVALAAIRAHDGDGKAWAAAKARLEQSKLAEEARAERVAELVAAAEVAIAAEAPDWPAVEAAIAAVAEVAGAGTPPVDRLQAAATERRLQLAFSDALADVDAALNAGRADSMTAVIADESHAVRLSGLLEFSGLMVEHRISALERTPDGVVSVVTLATEMDVAPRSEVVYRYRWNRIDGRWQVVEAERILDE